MPRHCLMVCNKLSKRTGIYLSTTVSYRCFKYTFYAQRQACRSQGDFEISSLLYLFDHLPKICFTYWQNTNTNVENTSHSQCYKYLNRKSPWLCSSPKHARIGLSALFTDKLSDEESNTSPIDSHEFRKWFACSSQLNLRVNRVIPRDLYGLQQIATFCTL